MKISKINLLGHHNRAHVRADDKVGNVVSNWLKNYSWVFWILIMLAFQIGLGDLFSLENYCACRFEKPLLVGLEITWNIY